MATLVSASPVDNRVIRRFRDTCTEMNWDPEWFPGIRGDETNRVHVLPGPEGSSTSWVHHALTSLLSRIERTSTATGSPTYGLRRMIPPFFRDFFRWASIGKLRQAFGPLWPARSEMGFLVLLMAAVCTALTALILLPGPMLLLWRARDAPTKTMTLLVILYFGGLGTGFMLLEMSFIQLFTRFLGDPIRPRH